MPWKFFHLPSRPTQCHQQSRDISRFYSYSHGYLVVTQVSSCDVGRSVWGIVNIAQNNVSEESFRKRYWCLWRRPCVGPRTKFGRVYATVKMDNFRPKIKLLSSYTKNKVTPNAWTRWRDLVSSAKEIAPGCVRGVVQKFQIKSRFEP